MRAPTPGSLPQTTTSTPTLSKTATTTDHEPFETSQQAAAAAKTPATPPTGVPSAKQTQPAVALAAASGKCRNGSPLANVYHPYRLQVIKACITVTGAVTRVRYEDDGDIHINLSLPAAEQSLLNNGNRTDEDGDLVTEIVPADQPGCTPGKPPPLPVTAYRSGGYTYGICTGADLPTPAVGDQVSVTGPYVLDMDHGWMEVHPVWSITVGAAATGTASASGSALSQWAQGTKGSVTGLMRAAVALKLHPGALARCAVLGRALQRATRATAPPNARAAWRHALTYLLSASTACHAHAGGRIGRTRLRVALGVRLLRRFGTYLAHRGIPLGEDLVILVASPAPARSTGTSAPKSSTQPGSAASPTTSTPRPVTTVPPPPTTTTAPPPPPTTSTEPPPPPPPPPPTTTTAPPPSGAWCTATAGPANDGYSTDVIVYVHSNQPYTDATASGSGNTWGKETNATGDATILLYYQTSGAPISVTVGAAHCSTAA